jgi:hypothetical protein
MDQTTIRWHPPIAEISPFHAELNPEQPKNAKVVCPFLLALNNTNGRNK